MTNLKLLPTVQVGMALLVVILVLATPFGSFRYYGYGAFVLRNTDIELVTAAVVLTCLGIAYAGYMWGWKTSGPMAKKYAKLTLYFGVFQWLWVVSLALALWDDITYNATFTLGRYYWWLDAGSYALILGAIVLTITGLLAVHKANILWPALPVQTSFSSTPPRTYPGQPSPPASSSSSSTGTGTRPVNEVRYCPNCGASMLVDAAFCPRCGAKTLR